MLSKADSHGRGEQKGFGDCSECGQSLYDFKQCTDGSADAGKGAGTDACNRGHDVCLFACCGTASSENPVHTEGESWSLCSDDGFCKHWLYGIPGTGCDVRQWSTFVWSGLSDSI